MTIEDEKGRRRWKPPADVREPSDGRTMAKREKVRKKTLSKSSREWVDRQLRDPYVRRAQEAGYRARAAYKLLEIDEKFHVLKRGARIVDLGCAPGGWLQVAAEKGAAKIVGVDLLAVDPVDNAT
ncbi:MAG TPA: RlmE family RNA methyltransferase, partial [Hyphomonadaceae bacterium]|nr:RlmE family RNA methyltransferase [Hyphomonadaceae bacterium]